MAERRMFTGKITESDAFLDMPLTSQCLYFHLCMYADDEGFVKNPKRIQRMIGATDDDYKLLIAKSFVLIFESGVIVIKHWKMHNAIRKDRMHETEYVDEKSMLFIKDNGAYTFDPLKGAPLVTTKCQPNDNQMSTKCQAEVRLGKDSIDKDIKEKINKKEKSFKKPTVDEVAEYCRERNNGINPHNFIDYYEAKGWMIGKNKMKDWKAAVRTWENRRKEENKDDRSGNDDEERKNAELDEYIERLNAGEFDNDDDGLWDDLPDMSRSRLGNV